MTEALGLALVFFGGAALGLLYFAGLWVTVRQVAGQAWPGVWLIVSSLLRIALLMAGLFLLMAGAWERVALALAGFLLARTLLVARARKELHARHP